MENTVFIIDDDASVRDALVDAMELDLVGPRDVPVLGSREALFSFAQSVIDGNRPDPLVVCPNPFYQIYEGAAFLAGCAADPPRS